jgi:hypothetical protein
MNNSIQNNRQTVLSALAQVSDNPLIGGESVRRECASLLPHRSSLPPFFYTEHELVRWCIGRTPTAIRDGIKVGMQLNVIPNTRTRLNRLWASQQLAAFRPNDIVTIMTLDGTCVLAAVQNSFATLGWMPVSNNPALDYPDLQFATIHHTNLLHYDLARSTDHDMCSTFGEDGYDLNKYLLLYSNRFDHTVAKLSSLSSGFPRFDT